MFHFTNSFTISPFFSLFRLLSQAVMDMFLLDGACRLNTLISKKLFSCLPPQTPLAEISSLALLCRFTIAMSLKNPSGIGCNSGSVRTSLQTSDSRPAVKSRILLCLIMGKPPYAQDRAWSTVKVAPHSQY